MNNPGKFISNLTNCLQVVVMDLKDSNNEEPQSNSKNSELKTKLIVLIGDSIIKHIDPIKAFPKACAQIFIPWENHR